MSQEKNLAQINFLSKIHKHYADILANFTGMLKNEKGKNGRTKIVWSQNFIDFYHKSKHELSNAALLSFLRTNGKLVLHSVTRDIAVVATLSILEGFEYIPQAFFSRRLSPSQTKYLSFDRELFALQEYENFIRRMSQA